MSLFSLREFYSRYVVCMYLYDNGGEIVVSSKHNGVMTPLFARGFVIKSSMDDAFFFEDIAPFLKKLLLEIKHVIHDVRVVSHFKKELVWEIQKKEITEQLSREIFFEKYSNQLKK